MEGVNATATQPLITTAVTPKRRWGSEERLTPARTRAHPPGTPAVIPHFGHRRRPRLIRQSAQASNRQPRR
jgi:hypothetical protein